MPHTTEKSTNQLAVWWRLAEASEESYAAWQQTLAVTGTVDSSQLPANIAVALARSVAWRRGGGRAGHDPGPTERQWQPVRGVGGRGTCGQ